MNLIRIMMFSWKSSGSKEEKLFGGDDIENVYYILRKKIPVFCSTARKWKHS